MLDFITWVLPIIEDSWLLQGLIGNTVFTIGSIPFTKIKIRNMFKNRKRKRIKDAQNELKILCLQKMIAEKHIEKSYFENLLFILASKYNIEVNDIYNDEKVFGQSLINTIINDDLIDSNIKEEIAFQIRNNKIFVNLEYNNIIDENVNILSGESDIPSSEDDIELNKSEKQIITKLTLLVTIGIFVSLLFIISIGQILYNAYGMNTIIFIDTITIMIIMIPIIINGVIHYEKFHEKSKKYFYLFLVIMLLNIVNFICIVNILLKH